MADIARQGLEPASETGAIRAERTKTMGEVAGLADHLVQQLDDLVGRRGRTGFSVRRQTSGERCSKRRDAGKRLTQPVVQFAAEALFFVIGDLKDLPFQQFVPADVTGHLLNPSFTGKLSSQQVEELPQELIRTLTGDQGRRANMSLTYLLNYGLPLGSLILLSGMQPWCGGLGF